MEREIYSELLDWKKSDRRKPLILEGARQVGKTYLMKYFGSQEYESVAYLNFEENPELDSIFSNRLDVKRVISELGLIAGVKILPGKTLIIFDEIQESSSCLNSLKFFNENANEFHIISAGSLLGIKLNRPKNIPLGKVNYLKLYPLNFYEFLRALGKNDIVEKINSTDIHDSISEILHNEFIYLLKTYLVIGGMPEVVKHYVEENNFLDAREIQNEILRGYELDFSKHAPATDIPRISLIWKSIPSQLAKENKKFVYKCVRSGARAREFESALQWLFDASLIYKCSNVEVPKIPLKSYTNDHIFKIYMGDVGLLGALSQIEIKEILVGNKVFSEFTGAFIENYVAQNLVSRDFKNQKELFYWTSSATSEVDFLFQRGSEIIPLEVKSGENVKGKSLKVFYDKYGMHCYRTTALNFKIQDWVTNIPLYAVKNILNTID